MIAGNTIATGLKPHERPCMTIGDEMNWAADCCPKLADHEAEDVGGTARSSRSSIIGMGFLIEILTST